MKEDASNKKSILFMVQIPPPVHGAALRNKSLLDSPSINQLFNVRSLPLRFIEDMKDLGKFSVKKIGLAVIYAVRLFTSLLTKQTDLVYFTMSPSGGAFYRDILFLFIIKLFSKKRILHFRVKGIKKTGETRLGRALVRYAFKGSEVVCLSRNHTLDLAEFVYNDVYIVPNGIQIEKEIAAQIAAEKVQPNLEPRILFLSNLSKKKGIPDLIEALSIVKKAGFRFSASLVGQEWDMSYQDVRALIQQYDLVNEIKIEGPKYGKEKFIYVSRSDIFIFPTYFELFPGVILEAMQFGRAIISTFEGSIPEIIDNGVNGILVQQQQAAALAEATIELLSNPRRREIIGHNARIKFFNEFTLASFEKKMANVFIDVINKR